MQREELSMEHRDKHIHFSIRKFNLGVASVAIASLWLLGGPVVHAESAVAPASEEKPLVASASEEANPASDNEELGTEETPAAQLADEKTDIDELLRSAVDTADTATSTQKKQTVFKPAEGVTITEVDGKATNAISTEGFSTTKPTVTNMQRGKSGSVPATVHHKSDRYTFAVIHTAHHGDYYNKYVGYETSGKIWFGDKGTKYDGQYYYGKWSGYTRVDQIAFSTDEDGSGNVYATFYSDKGAVIREDVFKVGEDKEITYNYNGKDPKYTFRYATHTALTDKSNNTFAVDGPYPEGWFNELYTNFTALQPWQQLNKYISYGWDVPQLVDKPTEYRDIETGKLLGTVVQTELSGYSFDTSAPKTIKTSDGTVYTLEKSVNTSGKITSLINMHDALNVARDDGFIVRHELINEDGTVAWYVLDKIGNKVNKTDGTGIAIGELKLGETTTVDVNVPRQGKTTFYIANPAANLGKTTYYYRATNRPTEVKKGSVQVRYITEDNQVLEDTTAVKTNEPVGTKYDTVKKAFDGYTFVKVDEKGAPASGTVEEGTKTVTYIYKKVESPTPAPTPEVKRGTVLVRHITEDGEALDETRAVVRDGKVGSGYITEAGQFDGYSLFKIDENGAPAQGLVKEGIQTVIYIYKKIETPAPTPEVKKGSVQVRYITEDNRVLEGPIAVKTNELVGTKYETVKKTFAGYTFVKVDENGALAQGLVKEGTQIVTYIYRKIETPIPAPSPEVKTGSVVARYVIQGTEMTIAANTIVKPAQTPVDELYSDTPPIAIRFAGKEYILLHTRNKAGDAPQTGKVIEGKQIITYEYKEVAKTPAPAPEVKKGSVQVLYITEDGQVLEGPTAVQTNEPVGTIYTTEQKVFSGYTFVKVDEAGASTTGTVEEGTKIVTYIYKKDETAPTPPSVEVPLMSPTPTTPVARAVPKTAILPATGENNSALALVGIALLGAVAVASHRRKKK